MRQSYELLEHAFNDATDDFLRVAVLDRAASDFWGTKDKAVAKFLAGIVLGDEYSRDVRLVAYLDLYEVCARPLSALPDVNDFKIPEDLDLQFLHEYLTDPIQRKPKDKMEGG